MSLEKRRPAASWESVSMRWWKDFTPPWRPSAQDLESYLSALKSFRPARIFILGGTPELRLMAASLGAEVSVADFSANMLDEMGRYLPPAAGAREKRILADWHDLRAAAGSFDAVLGDLGLRLIAPARQAGFLGKIAGCLRSKGRLITRLHFTDASVLGRPAMEIIRKTIKEIPPVKKDPYYCASVIRARLFDAGTWRRDSGKIRALAGSGDAFEKAVAEILLDKLRSPAVFFGQSKRELESKLRAAFKIVSRRSARDYHDAGFYPVYTLEKR